MPLLSLLLVEESAAEAVPLASSLETRVFSPSQGVVELEPFARSSANDDKSQRKMRRRYVHAKTSSTGEKQQDDSDDGIVDDDKDDMIIDGWLLASSA